MDSHRDAFGNYLLARLEGRENRSEFIERDDDFLDTGRTGGPYFLDHASWSAEERDLVDQASGRVLDIGCGAGRHALWLQSKGLDVTGIDSSPGAIEVCRRRGLRQAIVRQLFDVQQFGHERFDTVLLLGANLGLLESRERAPEALAKLHAITNSAARIFAGTRDPYRTTVAEHLAYHEANRSRGRMAGQARIRVRYGCLVGDWFDYLFVSPAELADLVAGTGWAVEKLIETRGAEYFVVLRRLDR